MTILMINRETLLPADFRAFGTPEGVKKGWLKRRRAVGRMGESTGLFWKLKTQGGFTYHPIHKNSPKDGFVVALYKRYETVLKGASVTASSIGAFIKAHRALFDANKDAHVGGWFDQASGNVFLDVSVLKKSRTEAAKLGKKHKQLAIFDLKRMREIRLAAGKPVRFDFPPDATPEEIAAAIRKLAE